MNANELADELENKPLAYGNDIQEWLEQAATMLRQQQEQINNLKQWEKRQLYVIEAQQAEIEALKAHLNAYQVAYNPSKHGVENE